MLHSWLKTALRGLLRQPLFALINIVGLAGGLACSLLILSYVQHERSYEDFNPRADRVFQLMEGNQKAWYPAALAGLILGQMPQVEAVAPSISSGRPLLSYGRRQFYHRVTMGDTNLLELLDLPFVYGDRDAALIRPYAMVLSERVAQQFFGDRDPTGELLRWDTACDIEVTGVFSPPTNTHYEPELILSLRTVEVEPAYGPIPLQIWSGRDIMSCYVQLAPGASAESFGDSLVAMARRAGPDWLPDRLLRSGGPPSLCPIGDLHLAAAGHGTRVDLLALIGVFVLMVACVNSINLSTARSAQRVREIGIRKAIGVHPRQLAGQFLLESLLQVLVATLVSAAIAGTCAPAYEALTGFELHILSTGSAMWIQLLGLAGVAVLGAGYPAAVLARLPPTRVFRDASRAGSMGAAVRRRLVEFQFALAILLCLGTAAVHHQLEYMRRSDLGYDKGQVLTYKTGYQGLAHLSLPMLSAMAEVPGVLGVAGYSDPPFSEAFGRWNTFNVRVGDSEEAVSAHSVIVSGSFVPTMGMDIIAGRSHRPHLPRGKPEFVLNEAAVAALGFDGSQQAIGAQLRVGWQGVGPVVGVVRDFHYQTLHEPIGPTVVSSPKYDNRYAGGAWIEGYSNYLVRVAPAALPGVLGRLETVWRSHAPDYPFSYQFLDESFDRRHRAEQQLSSLMGWFTATALLLTGLGVFAMAAYAAQQRTKEIGVRKVLGSTRSGILLTLTREFLRTFAVGSVVALPVGIWAVSRWLDSFPYHIEVSPGLVLVALAAVLGTAGVAMAHQVLRASRLDPVEALRYE